MDTSPLEAGHHRAIVVVDIESSTTRTNVGRAWLRAAMYKLLRQALRISRIAERHRDPLIDRGDGVLILIHPVKQAPKTVLITTFVPTLARLIAEHNARMPDHQFRLRVAIHAGDIHYDNQGVFGEAVDATFRLLQASEVKQQLAVATDPLILVVSSDIYDTVVRQGYSGIDKDTYEDRVQVRIGNHQYSGWVHLPQPSQANAGGQRIIRLVQRIITTIHLGKARTPPRINRPTPNSQTE